LAVDVKDIERIIRDPVTLPRSFDSYYDREADVLYVTFAEEWPPPLGSNDLILHSSNGGSRLRGRRRER
jgi:hypothetical protein